MDAYAKNAMHEPFLLKTFFGLLGQVVTFWPKHLSYLFLKILKKSVINLDLIWIIFPSGTFS